MTDGELAGAFTALKIWTTAGFALRKAIAIATIQP